MTSCFNIQSTTADWVKTVKEIMLEFVAHEDDLIQDVIW